MKSKCRQGWFLLEAPRGGSLPACFLPSVGSYLPPLSEPQSLVCSHGNPFSWPYSVSQLSLPLTDTDTALGLGSTLLMCKRPAPCRAMCMGAVVSTQTHCTRGWSIQTLGALFPDVVSARWAQIVKTYSVVVVVGSSQEMAPRPSWGRVLSFSFLVCRCSSEPPGDGG